MSHRQLINQKFWEQIFKTFRIGEGASQEGKTYQLVCVDALPETVAGLSSLGAITN